MERAWAIASILCLIVASVLFLRENYDGAFVAAILGVSAGFLSYRVKLRATTIAAEERGDQQNDDSEDHDEN